MRKDGRQNDQLRAIHIEPNYLKHADGSAFISLGDTKIICSAIVGNEVPPFLKDKGQGWLTSEYSLLPYSTKERSPRESVRGKIGGRTHEIQRIIGRSLRGIINLTKIGERTIWIDCDVVQADGGTRTLAITGSFIALSLAMEKLLKMKLISEYPMRTYLAGASVGIVRGQAVLDLCYEEDKCCEVDMNVVMQEDGEFVEIQGTAENKSFSKTQLNEMLTLAQSGITQLIQQQKNILQK
jgi:ribonuclease PH